MLYLQKCQFYIWAACFFKKLRRVTALEKLLTGLCVWGNPKINQRQDWALKCRWGWIHHCDRMQGQIFQFNNDISQQQKNAKNLELSSNPIKKKQKNKNNLLTIQEPWCFLWEVRWGHVAQWFWCMLLANAYSNFLVCSIYCHGKKSSLGLKIR